MPFNIRIAPFRGSQPFTRPTPAVGVHNKADLPRHKETTCYLVSLLLVQLPLVVQASRQRSFPAGETPAPQNIHEVIFMPLSRWCGNRFA